MYESEVNEHVEPVHGALSNVLALWTEQDGGIVARSLLTWGEHCTECAIPRCFLTCDLYQERKVDLSCQRFANGMARVKGSTGLVSWLLKIEFKKWAKLWAEGTAGLVPVAQANRLERWNAGLGAIVRDIPGPRRVKKSLAWRFRHARERWAKKITSVEKPDYFLVEAYNPGDRSVALTLSIRNSRLENHPPPFVARLVMGPGPHRYCFPSSVLNQRVDLQQIVAVELSPSDSDEQLQLYFGCLDFVKDNAWISSRNPGGCKCVVWDLDNTLWDGVLIEDGLPALRLKPGIRDTFAELDRRGILISVVSKNNRDDAIAALVHFGLDQYVMKPQISWEPKSHGVRRIAAELNIGLEGLLYIDDSPFERAEIGAACPEVLVVDAAETDWLLWREEVQTIISEESARRRLYYKEDEHRNAARQSMADDYESFLRDCQIRVRILPLDEGLLSRVHELAQRTNQMNFSGNRYTREQLEQLLCDPSKETLAIEVEDRFGSYGVVGFSVYDRASNTLSDLAFSCRIQSKRIEHALLTYLSNTHAARPIRARWRKTDRNAPAGKVFADLGFREVSTEDGITELEFDGGEISPVDFIQVMNPTAA